MSDRRFNNTSGGRGGGRGGRGGGQGQAPQQQRVRTQHRDRGDRSVDKYSKDKSSRYLTRDKHTLLSREEQFKKKYEKKKEKTAADDVKAKFEQLAEDPLSRFALGSGNSKVDEFVSRRSKGKKRAQQREGKKDDDENEDVTEENDQVMNDTNDEVEVKKDEVKKVQTKAKVPPQTDNVSVAPSTSSVTENDDDETPSITTSTTTTTTTTTTNSKISDNPYMMNNNATTTTNEEVQNGKKPKSIKGRLIEARKEFEQKRLEKEQRKKAMEDKKNENLMKHKERRQESLKLMKRTKRGQPIMKNQLNKLLQKIESS
ncbi:hypothetical protein SAMD00019534_112300 [Acytostelium subglobosum LB1]|uniref:hypothetical protein n=1 Tax=Acytostelium subglobosum LB1 TaxID=1410327 RepID=UPI000644B626|nr:hypothetical protein SAMD00019534_112300 [Acytostelium subglobosum LB1]GAM28054.1 hypothetical protein SAMD00019534_112300 [Acytostelium subglobosum LB1]|eukprot:XP_012749013.1 hypothetical protein SAMD00019534_112300 [Acytostelium subglobosum LB1]